MNIFELAEMELQREGINTESTKSFPILLDRAITIRKYMDLSERNTKAAKNRYANKGAK